MTPAEEFAKELVEAFRRSSLLLLAIFADGGRSPGPVFTRTAAGMGLDPDLKPLPKQGPS